MEIDIFLPISRDSAVTALKRFSKSLKKSEPDKPLAWFQNQVAVSLGYPSWTILQKHILKMLPQRFNNLADVLYAHAQLHAFMPRRETEDDARRAMRQWVSERYSPLINWAFYDSESENGFSVPSVEIEYELQVAFDERYPLALIEEVAIDLEVNEGPWGDEDFYMSGD